jgi:trimethylamine---corrinoid protein Co-methyltransferase
MGAAGASGEGAAPLRKQPLAPIRPDLRVCAHDGAQVQTVVDAAYALLERTGMKCRSAKGLAIFKAAGATVDEASGLVRLPRPLVEEALALAPRSFVMGSRDGASDLDLGSGETYGTTDGCGVTVLDWRTGERRPSTKADVADVTRMQDYLGSIAFWWPTVGAGDCGRTAQLHELEAGWNNTTKHLMGMVQGEKLAQYAVEMAVAVADARGASGGPVLSDLLSSVSPLILDEDAVEAGLAFGRAGLPVCYLSMPLMGATSPATPAGTYALALAEVMAQGALHELGAPGAPVLGSLMCTYTDPRTALAMTLPLDDRGRLLATQLVHAVGLPSMAAFGGTDAREPGTWQHGVEEGLQFLEVAIDGCETFTGLGLIDSYNVFAPENLILDDDLYHRARCAFLRLPLDDDALALEAIDEVGPGGNYLAHRHTRRHLRETVVRAVTHDMSADGRRYRDAVEVARERAHEILAHYEPPPLDENARRELERIVAAADAASHGR